MVRIRQGQSNTGWLRRGRSERMRSGAYSVAAPRHGALGVERRTAGRGASEHDQQSVNNESSVPTSLSTIIVP